MLKQAVLGSSMTFALAGIAFAAAPVSQPAPAVAAAPVVAQSPQEIVQQIAD